MPEFGILGELIDDQVIWDNRLAIKIYKFLHDEHPDIYYVPQTVKAWPLARKFRRNGKEVRRAIQLLIDRGFVADRGREANGCRRLLFIRARPHMSEKDLGRTAALA